MAWKKSHHLDVTSCLYVFVIWRKKMWTSIHPFHPNVANFCLKKPRHHPESSRNQDHLLWVASKKPSPNRPGIRPGEAGGQIYPSADLRSQPLKIDIKHSPSHVVWKNMEGLAWRDRKPKGCWKFLGIILVQMLCVLASPPPPTLGELLHSENTEFVWPYSGPMLHNVHCSFTLYVHLSVIIVIIIIIIIIIATISPLHIDSAIPHWQPAMIIARLGLITHRGTECTEANWAVNPHKSWLASYWSDLMHKKKLST